MFQSIPARASVRQGGLTIRVGICAAFFLTVVFSPANLHAQVAAPSSRPAAAPAKGQGSPASSTAVTRTGSTNTSSIDESRIIVTGDELPSAYGAPGAFSKSRFSAITNAYVLPPGAVFAALIYQGDVFSDKPTKSKISQEIEIGLPYRFGIAMENKIENVDSDTVNKSVNFEARWALADWDKIPLNPTLFAEYKIGTEADRVDAYEVRLLLSEELGHGVGWAFNPFLENETSGDRTREWGFAQSIRAPFFLPHERFKAGIEMQYKNKSKKNKRSDPEQSFVIGPSFSFKPTARMSLDIAPLVGATDDAPDVSVYAVFSYVFGGGGGETEGEAPASMRNR